MIQFNVRNKHFTNSHNMYIWSDWRPLSEKCAFFKIKSTSFIIQCSIRLSTVLTVRSNAQRKFISLAGISAVSTVCMHRWKQHELWTYYCIDYTPQCTSTAAARTHHCNEDVQAERECPILDYHQTIDRHDKEHTLPHLWIFEFHLVQSNRACSAQPHPTQAQSAWY